MDVTAVFFADENPKGGSTSAFHSVVDNSVLIVYTPGTSRNADDFCVLTWVGGWEPQEPWNQIFEADVFITPKNFAH